MFELHINLLKEGMKRKKITQEDLAEKLNISRQSISNLLTNKTFSKKLYENIYRIIYGEYTNINLLEKFSNEDLLKELLKREKNKNNYELY